MHDESGNGLLDFLESKILSAVHSTWSRDESNKPAVEFEWVIGGSLGSARPRPAQPDTFKCHSVEEEDEEEDEEFHEHVARRPFTQTDPKRDVDW